MIYRDISSRVLVARLGLNYTITGTDDWIPLVPSWIKKAMSIIKMPLAYKLQEPYDMPIVNRLGQLPCNLELVKYILKDNKALKYIADGMTVIPENVDSVSDIYYYEYTRSGHIMCNFRSGTVQVYYTALDVEYDNKTGLQFPYIPYNELLLEALEQYVLLRILQKGGAVMGFNLKENNEFTNPGLAWKGSLDAIRIGLSDDYTEVMRQLDDMTTAFIRPLGEENDRINTIHNL